MFEKEGRGLSRLTIIMPIGCLVLALIMPPLIRLLQVLLGK